VIANVSARLSGKLHGRALLAALLLAAVAAACGGSDSSGSSATTSTTGTTGAAGGAGADGGSVTGDSCFDYASFEGAQPAVTFTADVLPLFRRSCGLSASCHGADPAPAGRPFLGPPMSAGDVTADQAKAIVTGLVGVTSSEEASLAIVAAGAPDKSFLLYKLDGADCAKLPCAATKSCGESMPQGSALAQSERDVLRRWVAQGAKAD
jgi:hypothetical protein